MNYYEIENTIISFLQKYNVRRISVFGSFVRRELSPESDIDLIVSFYENKSLLMLIRIERELSERLGRKVDMLTEEAISPYLADIIKSESRVLYQ